jgi:hypothetical protein
MAPLIQPLGKLSPSQYGRLLRCPYQVLLEKSVEGKALQATPGRGAGGTGPLGTIIHGVLEQANLIGIEDETAFEIVWQQQLIVQETKLIKKQQGYLVPLAYRARNYAVRKMLVRWLVVGKKPAPTGNPAGSVEGPEKKLTDRTGIISGTADLIRRQATGELEILDYKTGRIMEQTVNEAAAPEVKEEYVLQLRLYAALVYEQEGKWPARLLIADLAGGEHEVAFTQGECMDLLVSALQHHKQLNLAVAQGRAAEVARPAAALCTACAMRPLCEPYAEWLADPANE